MACCSSWKMFSCRSRSRVTSLTTQSVIPSAAAAAQRPHPQPQPVHRPALQAGDAHLLLGDAAFARRLEHAVHRFRHVRIADEDALDRAHVAGAIGVGQGEIGGVGIDHAAAPVGDEEPVHRLVGDRLEQRIVGLLAGDAQDAGRQRKQREHADGGEEGEQNQDVGRGIAAADHEQPDRGANQRNRDDQHHADAAAARAGLAAIDDNWPVLANVLSRHWFVRPGWTNSNQIRGLDAQPEIRRKMALLAVTDRLSFMT